MKIFKNIFVVLVFAWAATSSCTKDLDKDPIDPFVVTSANVFNRPEAYKEALAKIYAGFAITGQRGPAGSSDINVNDEGFTSYLRLFWCDQELSTDEAINAWNDAGLPDLHLQTWSASNNFTRYLYDRIYYEISLANEFIRSVTPNAAGLSGQLKTDVGYYLAEARFARALAYYHALDMFGNVPFVTENDPVGSFFPQQISRDSLFNYIERELLAIEPLMVNARQNEYGRADKATVWALLARLYLNSHVYLKKVDTKYYTACIDYCKRIMNAGYSLHPVYKELFMADNNLRTDEILFAVAFDGTHTQTWGGMTFVISAQIGGDMNPAEFGSNQKWGGNRVTSAFVAKFPDPSGNTDKRAMFFTSGQTLEINNVGVFKEGYAVTKFSNKKSNGQNGSNQIYVDTDYPVFRLADIFLMYAEAVLRGGTGGDLATARDRVNDVRRRAYGNSSGDITTAQLTLPFILDERARELYWEGLRRTDLIRFGQFTNGTYLWPWKGGVATGVTVSSERDLFPIPASDLGANPNLKQNPGY